jgi:hypothetical protein
MSHHSQVKIDKLANGEHRSALWMVQRDLATLVGWRADAPLNATEAARYRSLCDSEEQLLNQSAGRRCSTPRRK